MKFEKEVKEWLAVSNAFDLEKYLKFYHVDAVLEDTTLGEVFNGHEGVRKYFEDHFIGYKTHTKLIKQKEIDNDKVFLDLKFNGSAFNDLSGVFELTFDGGKIRAAKAYLL